MKEVNVLVVEDNADLRELIEQHLCYLNLNVKTASNVGDAIQLIEDAETRFDIIITDLQLDDGDSGYDVVAWTRNLNNTYKAKARFILMTGFHSEFDSKTAQDYGINLFLTKPFDPNLLEEQIMFLIGDMDFKAAA